MADITNNVDLRLKEQKNNNKANTAIIIICVTIGILFLCFIVSMFYKRSVDYYAMKNDPKIQELREHFTKFWNKPRTWPAELSYLSKRDIMNETTLQRGEKSYTINKKDVYMCLVDENGNYYPFNMLVYVLAHEYAHVISTSIGHTDEFHRKFDILLDIMIREGFYDPSEEIILDYCLY